MGKSDREEPYLPPDRRCGMDDDRSVESAEEREVYISDMGEEKHKLYCLRFSSPILFELVYTSYSCQTNAYLQVF